MTSGESAAKAGKWKAVAAVLRKAREQRRLTQILECKDQGPPSTSCPRVSPLTTGLLGGTTRPSSSTGLPSEAG